MSTSPSGDREDPISDPSDPWIDGEFCWDGLDDPDTSLPPDPAHLIDTGEDWVSHEMNEFFADLPHDSGAEPPIPTPEQFASDVIERGPDAAALALAALEPGPRAAALIALLDPQSLSPEAMVTVIAATERLASWVQARQHRWLATFACPGVAAPVDALTRYASQPGQPLHPGRAAKSADGNGAAGAASSPSQDLWCSGSALYGDPDVDTVLDAVAVQVAAAEIGAALHLSPIAAGRRVGQAVEFAVDLPSTLRALEAGAIDRARALTIADRTQNLPVELRRRVEEAVLPKATTRTPGQLRGIVDRAVISVDPQAAKKRHERAVSERDVSCQPGPDGTGTFQARLAADKAQVAFSVIDQLAYQLKRNPNHVFDPRGIGALRADVFSDLFDQLATTGSITIGSTLRRRATCSTDGEGDAAGDSAGESESTQPSEQPSTSRTESTQTPTSPTESVESEELLNPDRVAAVQRVAARSDSACPNEEPTSEGPDSACPNEEPASERPDSACADEEPASEGPDSACSDEEPASKRPDSACPDEEPATEGPDSACPEGSTAPAGVDPDSETVALDAANSEPGESRPTAGTSVSGSAFSEVCSDATDPQNRDLPERGQIEGAVSDFRWGTQHGRQTHLNVTIAQSTLLGMDDRPGELDGYGTIPADLARAIALSADTINAIAIDPNCGTALDLGRTSYRPRLAQRDHVTTRDQTCRFPGCRQAAKRCQLDHSNEFCPDQAEGGVTCPCNLACLCQFHHGLKTGGLWDTSQQPDGTLTWTSPTGRHYETQPRQWPTDMGDQEIPRMTEDAPQQPNSKGDSPDGGNDCDGAGSGDGGGDGIEDGDDDAPPF